MHFCLSARPPASHRYFNWQGFDFLFYIQRSHWGALKFFRTLRYADIHFFDK